MTKVLIIDDNKKNVELLRDFIESWGYETMLAYQGRKALEIVQETVPDIILLDVMLPGMSGFEVCQALKDNPGTRDVPVVMITALTAPEDRVNGFATGADYFMVKPVNYKELKAILENAVRKKTRLDSMENQELVLQKIYTLLHRIMGKELSGRTAERLEFFANIFKHIGLSDEETEKALDVLKFQPVYQKMVRDKELEDVLQEAFTGLQCDRWMNPLILYSCTEYENRNPEVVRKLEDLELLDLGQLCYEVSRFDRLAAENGFEMDKALEAFRQEKKRFGYSDEFLDALVKEKEDQDLRKLIENNFKECKF